MEEENMLETFTDYVVLLKASGKIEEREAVTLMLMFSKNGKQKYEEGYLEGCECSPEAKELMNKIKK